MKGFSLRECVIDGGFWETRQTINAESTIPSVYNRFEETGRFQALKCEKQETPTHIFWDSDIAKWLEAAAYLLSRKEDKKIRAWFDGAVEDICSHQLQSGYFNSYFQVYEPQNIFTERDKHELYCAGHIFEAAVAAKEYLNDDRLLKFSEKYAAYIYERFVEKQDTGFLTPGHEEIELALLRLFELTGNDLYKTLAAFFINERGTERDKAKLGVSYYNRAAYYAQAVVPVREQRQVEGHAVRATYLYIAMADLARITGDKKLRKAAETLFDEIVEKKAYITGAIGSTNVGERFTSAYDLPNNTAYAETCASIGLAFLCDRMLKLTGEAKYGHIFERALYNGILSGVSLDGESFFYTNPLETDVELYRYNKSLPTSQAYVPIVERVKVFNCSCCPPNICRFIEELPSFIWYADEEKQELILSQYISSTLRCTLADATMISNFPTDGKLRVRLNSHGKKITLKLRIPKWCDERFENAENGYLVYEGVFNDEEICVEFAMRLKKVYANAKVWANSGKAALCYGPIVLCAEGVDNPFPLAAAVFGDIENAVIKKADDGYILRVQTPIYTVKNTRALYSYEPPVYEANTLTMIPYFAWANRGENSMRVWFPYKK